MKAELEFGQKLKSWRALRGLSQLALAQEIGVSARHLCFLETGRAKPSPEMLLRLSDGLDVPLRERNALLLSAGFAPRYSEVRAQAPELSAIHQVVSRLLRQQEPYPALVMNRYWDIVQMNQAARRMLAPFSDAQVPNAIELFLGNSDVCAAVENWTELAQHTRERLHAQLRRVGPSDPRLSALLVRADELLHGIELPVEPPKGPALTTRLRVGSEVIQTVTTIASFSGPGDVWVDDLRIELTFPVDEAAARCFQAAAAAES